MSKRLWLLLLVFALALSLRVYKLDQVPSSLYYDEVDYGYQARSLLTTGRDYRGGLSPFYVHSFNDIRTPIPAYLTVVTTWLPFPAEFQVRLPFALLGTLTVMLGSLLMYQWTKNFPLTLITASVLAVSPWQLQFSRFSHEVASVMPFLLLGLVFFFRFLKSNRFSHYWLFVFFVSLTVYTYRTMSLVAPLILIILSLLQYKQIFRQGIKRLSWAVVSAGCIILPFLYFTTLGSPDTPRIQQLAITSDPSVPIWVQRHREVDSGDYLDQTLGKKASWFSFVFHNKLLSWTTNFANNYWYNFSTDFLFLKGDANLRHGIGNRGHLYLVDLVALFVGLVFVFRHSKHAGLKWLLIWLCVSPIPAALTSDGAGHAARLFIFSTPLLLVISIGWWQIVSHLPRLSRPLVLVMYGLFVVFYLHRYYVHYPLEAARQFGYGFKQAVGTIAQLQDQYDQVALTATKDPPMIYYLFWSNTSPAILQSHGTDFSPGHPERPLGKFTGPDWETGSKPKPGVLYLLTQTELPADLRNPANIPSDIVLHKLIQYPDNEVAFYLISIK